MYFLSGRLSLVITSLICFPDYYPLDTKSYTYFFHHLVTSSNIDLDLGSKALHYKIFFKNWQNLSNKALQIHTWKISESRKMTLLQFPKSFTKSSSSIHFVYFLFLSRFKSQEINGLLQVKGTETLRSLSSVFWNCLSPLLTTLPK